MKDQIDRMSYKVMLRKWRFGDTEDPIFQGDTGKYFAKVMAEKKAKLPHSEQVAISKTIGWER